MNTKLFIGIAVRIIILFGVAMFATFLPEYLRDFFGDTLHDCSKTCTDTWCRNGKTPDKLWDWGARHYWYYWGMFLLFLLSLINVVAGIAKAAMKGTL